MSFRRAAHQGMLMTLDEAKAYAERLMEPLSIMYDARTGAYHVIREFGVAHWRQHYTEVLVCRPTMVFSEPGGEDEASPMDPQPDQRSYRG
jgi:hypothetical protein